MNIGDALSELLFPRRCISCHQFSEESPCFQCWTNLERGNFETNIQLYDYSTLSIISSVAYSKIASKILLSSKESRIARADEFVYSSLQFSLLKFLSQKSCTLLIPIPSRRANTRKRGREYMADFASQLASEHGLLSAALLTHTRRVKDQSSLGITQRWNNLEGSMVVDGRARSSLKDVGVQGLLIDDLVTTGATLAEASRALKYAGIEVIGGVTAFVAKPLR